MVDKRAKKEGPSASEMGKRGGNDSERTLRFVRLFTAHEPRVYSYIVAVLGNWTDADEVMQETSIALWEMFEQFQDGTDFCAWACRVAHFRILRFRQERKRDKHEFEPDLVETLDAVAVQELESFDERRLALSGCLETLNEADRLLLKKCYADGVLIKNVADELQRPVAALYKDLARIRKLLFECVTSKTGARTTGAAGGTP